MTAYESLARILANERERCARVCEEMARHNRHMASARREQDERTVLIHHAIAAELCAELIRIPFDAPLLHGEQKKDTVA